jgi:hypothetical protein
MNNLTITIWKTDDAKITETLSLQNQDKEAALHNSGNPKKNTSPPKH